VGRDIGGVDNFTGRSEKHLTENAMRLPKKVRSKEYMMELHKNLDNTNSSSSLARNINKNASPIQEYKLEMSTIRENHRFNQTYNNNLPFIYGESIKDLASEEKEINVDRLLHINKRFLEILKD
jgi:hypothetical protein